LQNSACIQQAAVHAVYAEECMMLLIGVPRSLACGRVSYVCLVSM